MTTLHIGVRDEHAPQFGRQVLTLWTGAFASGYVGHAVELPKHDGYMVTVGPHKVRVTAPAPRVDDNYEAVDAALEEAVRGIFSR